MIALLKRIQKFLVSSLCLLCCSPSVRAQQHYDVIVIGAGMAGIASAQQLQQAGLRVLVLESQARIGGRIKTSHQWGFPMELGAGWIHGEANNPVYQMAKAHQLAMQFEPPFEQIEHNMQIYAGPQQLLSPERLQPLLMHLIVFKSFLAQQKTGLAQDVPLQAILKQFIQQQQLSATAANLLHYALVLAVEYEYAAGLSQISSQAFEQDAIYSGRDVIVTQGYDQVINFMAQGLPIRTGESVSQVDYQQQRIAITTAEQIYYSDYVISTLPLGVLKKDRVKFIPALPEDKQSAIQRLAMGVLNRVYLRFDKVFWDTKARYLTYVPAKGGSVPFVYYNFYPHSQQPILVAFTAAEFAQQLEYNSDAEIIAHVLHDMKNIFGDNISELLHYEITRWGQDPHSFGAYSYVPAGASFADYASLAKPVAGRLFFAGEATHKKYPSTVHGAYLSGVRAAQEVLAAREGSYAEGTE
jgi:monoamine oxidase